MKLQLFSLLLAASLAADDVRLVSGKSVNLSPVHKWFKDQRGERPMPHWQKFSVEQLNGAQVGADVCRVKREDGEVVDILMLRLPATLKSLSSTVREQALQIASLKRRIELGDVHGERQAANLYNPNLTYEVKESQYFNSRLTKMNVAAARAVLAKLQSRQAEDIAALAVESEILAMNTGKKNGKLEIWDCGIVKR